MDRSRLRAMGRFQEHMIILDLIIQLIDTLIGMYTCLSHENLKSYLVVFGK